MVCFCGANLKSISRANCFVLDEGGAKQVAKRAAPLSIVWAFFGANFIVFFRRKPPEQNYGKPTKVEFESGSKPKAKVKVRGEAAELVNLVNRNLSSFSSFNVIKVLPQIEQEAEIASRTKSRYLISLRRPRRWRQVSWGTETLSGSQTSV